MGRCTRFVWLVPVFLCLASAVHAQGTLSGVVKDTSGAVLPGVTVEAASPVLIEKIRATVTDGGGQYRIIDLRGGLYTVTFALTGFATVKKEGVQLAGENIVTMNAEMRVGAVSETVTVSGEAPIVDVASTTRQQVITKGVIDTLPTGRNYSSLGVLLAGVNSTALDSGGASGDTMAQLTIHGSRPGDQRVMQNGVNTMTLQVNGDRGIAVPNPGMASEVTVDTSGMSAEQSQGGIRINYIPRDGGNKFSGSNFVTFANSRMQGNNLTDDLKARGLPSANSIKMLYDVNPGFGGPVKRDRMWFYFTGRVNRADQFAAGSFVNLNAYNPKTPVVVEDRTQPGYSRGFWTDGQMRLTTQATPRNKVAFTWDQQTRCSCPAGAGTPSAGVISSTVSPEAADNFRSPTQRLLHGEWSSPVTNKLLVEGAALHRTERWGNMQPNTEWSSDFITPAQQAVLQSGALVPILDTSNGRFSHGNFVGYNTAWVPNFYVRATASYVTGGHQLKAGFSNSFGYLDATSYDYSPYNYFINIAPGIPLSLINEKVTPLSARSDQNYDLGVFLQDRWTTNRLSLNLGVRYDAFKATAPAQVVVGKTPLTPNRADIALPETALALWQDFTPRFGLTYDVTGNGKTAIKVSVNKYLEGQSVGSLVGVLAGGAGPHPVSSLVNAANRLWFDGGPFPNISGAGGIPGDFVPQCDLTNPAANGECGAINNPGFGSTNTNAAKFDPDLQFGWGARGYNWEFGVGVQREIIPRVSVDVGYFRRIYGNFRVTDNTALDATDYTQFNITAPTAAGLSSSGQIITGVFDANRVVQATNLTAPAGKYGDQFEHWNGVDFSLNARLQNGLVLFGGVNTGKTVTDNCQVAAKVPESLGTIPLQFCANQGLLLTQVKMNGAYTIPKADVLVSATFQSVQGPRVLANYTITQRAPGVPLVASGTATVSLIAPGTEVGERINEVDLRIGKIFKVLKTRTVINLDLFNLFNSSVVTAENPAFLAFRRPTGIMLARYVKIGAQFDF